MTKVILFFVIFLVSQKGFTQKLIKLKFSDLETKEFVKKNKLEDFKYLATKTDVGIAYLEQNSTKTYNLEKGIKVLRVKSNNVEALNKSLRFSTTIEMIIIDVSEPNLNLNLNKIECNKLKQFSKLKYLYFINKKEVENNVDLKKINCLPNTVQKYYTSQLPS